MKREKFDIFKAHLLLASTLGVVFSSCNDKNNGKDNDKDKDKEQDKGKDKYKDINEQLKKMGSSEEVNEEKDLDKIKGLLDLDKGKKEEDVLNKLKEVNNNPNEEKNKKIIEKLTKKQDEENTNGTNLHKDDFSNSSLLELIQKLNDEKDVNSDIKSLTTELLGKKTEIENFEKDTEKKKQYDTIIKTLREKISSVLVKDSKAEDIASVKNSLTELKNLVIPKNTGDPTVLQNVEKIKNSLFKDGGPLKDLDHAEVYKNVFDFIVNEKEGKLSLYIEFKNIDKLKDKKLVLKDADCKKIFSTDDKDKSNFKDVIKDDEISSTLLYKILNKCIEAILKITTISNDKIEIVDGYNLVSDNNKSNWSKVDQIFKDVINKALAEVFTEIKEGSIAINDEFYQILGNVYSLLSIKGVDSDFEEFFISNEEGEISTWLLQNLGIIKDGDDYLMLKDDKDSIKLDENLKKQITEFGNSISIKKKKVNDVWKGILEELNKSISNPKTKMKGKNADGIYQEIKNAFKTNNKNKDDERFSLEVFDDKKWGVDLKNDLKLKDSEINGDGAKFENSGKLLSDGAQRGIQTSILERILTKRFNAEILKHFNAYKCLNNGKDIVDKEKYDKLVDALNTFLGLDIIAGLDSVVPFFKIKTQGSEVEPVLPYLKRLGRTDYNKLKQDLERNEVENASANAFKLNDIISIALGKVKQGGKVYYFLSKCSLNDGLEFNANSVKESAGGTGTVGVRALLLKKKNDDKPNWLDILAVIFKGNIDIYDNNKVIKNDAFANIFDGGDVTIPSAINIDTEGSKGVKITAATGQVTVS